MPRRKSSALTRRSFVRLGGGLIGLAGSGFLAACGGAIGEPTASTVPTVPASAPASVSPTAVAATAPPTATATLAPAPTSPATAAAPPVTPVATLGATATIAPPTAPPSAGPSAAPATATLPPFGDLPQGRTPDGFPFLGSAAAPVALIDYSDFL